MAVLFHLDEVEAITDGAIAGPSPTLWPNSDVGNGGLISWADSQPSPRWPTRPTVRSATPPAESVEAVPPVGSGLTRRSGPFRRSGSSRSLSR
ncbi:hypothetical protein SB749_01515 [Brevibacterium sp. SIMBA_078]|uniref:hypothetical protein n=1 Tax=Brevibacterium sp. SIMBA_078 TaxID=3085816 RepID=UPI00397AA7B6